LPHAATTATEAAATEAAQATTAAPLSGSLRKRPKCALPRSVAMCQEATYAVQRTRLLFDHAVCALLEKPSLPCSLDCAE